MFFRCENVSRVVRHFYFIELAFLSRLKHFEFLLKNGVRTFGADMFLRLAAFCETKSTFAKLISKTEITWCVPHLSQISSTFFLSLITFDMLNPSNMH